MDVEVIKSFLVGLGFGVDDSSLAKFNSAIKSASLRVAALYTSIQTTAAGIFWGISKMSQGFEDMGYQLRLVAPAINKMLILRQAMLSAYGAAGINIRHAVQQSILFNYSLAKTKFALEAAWKSVGVKFLPLLTKQMDIFRAKIFQNMPKIQEQLRKFVTFIFKAFDATVELGYRIWSILGRVWEFLKRLDQATDGWSTKILGFIAIWKLLNLSFLATPFGMLIAGITALIALYDDFEVWKEGGKSYFNWAPMVPTIEAVSKVLEQALIVIEAIAKGIRDILHGDWGSLLADLRKVENAFLAISNAVDKLVRSFNIPIIDKLLNWRDKVDASVFSMFGNANAAANFVGPMQPAPLLPSGAGVSQKVSQQTNIVVQGSADASSTGKAVAAEQSRVNFDMTRNLKGATR